MGKTGQRCRRWDGEEVREWEMEGEKGKLSEMPRGTLVYPQHLWGQCQSLVRPEV